MLATLAGLILTCPLFRLQVNGTVPAAGGAWGSNGGAWGGDAYSAPVAAEVPTASSGGGKASSKQEADLNRREVRGRAAAAALCWRESVQLRCAQVFAWDNRSLLPAKLRDALQVSLSIFSRGCGGWS